MRLSMQSGGTTSKLKYEKWNHSIVGDAIDVRGKAAIDFARTESTVTHRLSYRPKSMEVSFDGANYSAEEPEKAVTHLRSSRVLIEATTLSFAEILLCLRALRQLSVQSVSLVYTEPDNYARPRRSRIVQRRDFDLSEEVETFSAIPGNALLLRADRRDKILFFLGFEGQRMIRFLEQTGVSPSACSLVFGVPAFHPGWEMDSFANNFRVMPGDEMAGKIYFCGAQNPLSAYRTISRFHSSCGQNERLLLVPIGTKPHGVGAALFACEYPEVGVVYDNPKRKGDRSEGVRMWHLFEVQF